MPESIGERGDAVLFSFMRNSVRALPGPRTLVFLLSNQIGLVGMLMALAGGFVSGQVIFFAVVLGSGGVGVRSQVTTFGRYLL